jgi:hypothetical protein
MECTGEIKIVRKFNLVRFGDFKFKWEKSKREKPNDICFIDMKMSHTDRYDVGGDVWSDLNKKAIKGKFSFFNDTETNDVFITREIGLIQKVDHVKFHL